MPRPLEFDRERALIQAMKLFWSRGYSATSLAALLDAMGIQRSSFYASFGDKKSLFAESLQLFGQRTVALATPDRHHAAPEQRIWSFFSATLRDVPDSRLRSGCLLVNTILEMADTDDALCALSARQLAAVENAMQDALQLAGQQGRWASPMTPAAAARYLMTINHGLRVQSRKGLPRQSLWATLEDALSLIGLTPKETPARV